MAEQISLLRSEFSPLLVVVSHEPPAAVRGALPNPRRKVILPMACAPSFLLDRAAILGPLGADRTSAIKKLVFEHSATVETKMKKHFASCLVQHAAADAAILRQPDADDGPPKTVFVSSLS